MNILILNWRDIKNPSGGGAEILTHEIAKRWVDAGHQVRQFSSSYVRAKENEMIDGVEFIRKGQWWTVHIHAILYYLKHKNSIDVIIDEVHWFPFFSAVYAPKKTIALTCEIASKLLFRIFPYPVALIFYLLEKIYLKLYRKVPTMVISPSTKGDLLATGHIKENVIVLPMGITLPKNFTLHAKEKKPTIISVGRLNKQKGTMDLVEAFKVISKEIPDCSLWLVGLGEKNFINKVRQQIKEAGLTGKVKLFGFVTDEEKFSLLSRSHILVSASAHEGWGLTVPEAGLTKTPSVVYTIQGFRDIITHNKDGLLVDKNPKALAKGVLKLLHNPKIYTNMQAEAEKNSRKYSWDNAAVTAEEFITKAL